MNDASTGLFSVPHPSVTRPDSPLIPTLSPYPLPSTVITGYGNTKNQSPVLREGPGVDSQDDESGDLLVVVSGDTKCHRYHRRRRPRTFYLFSYTGFN